MVWPADIASEEAKTRELEEVKEKKARKSGK